jgi:phosphoribosylformylglycinamidine cyclo-ligase
VIMPADQADAAITFLNSEGLNAWNVGEIVERPTGAAQTIVI